MERANTIVVRYYRADDAAAVAEIFNRAVSAIGSGYYSAEQIAGWLDGGMEAEETQIRCSDGRSVWVAVDADDTAIAFIDLEDNGHIDMLFCTPDHSRQGIASALCGTLERAAIARGMTRLYVEASEVAKEVLQRRGFELLRRNDFEMKGITFHNYLMEKHL